MHNESLIIWEPLSQQYISLSISEESVTKERSSEKPQTYGKRQSFHRATTFSPFPETRPPKTAKSNSFPFDHTLAPTIPDRISSMSTRRRKDPTSIRPDLATFHRQSCQLFASLDGKLSPPPKYEDLSLRSSGSSSGENNQDNAIRPNKGSTTKLPADRAASFDNLTQNRHWHNNHTCRKKHQSFHGLQDLGISQQAWLRDSGNFEGVTLTEFDSSGRAVDSRIKKSRSRSKLSPQITSTEQIFWTSPETRQAEYAKIDRANSGLKGFVKKVVPERWWKPSRKKFYGEKNLKASVAAARPVSDGTRDRAVEEWIDATITANNDRRRKSNNSRSDNNDDNDDVSSVRRFRVSIELGDHAEHDASKVEIARPPLVVRVQEYPGNGGVVDKDSASDSASDLVPNAATTNTKGLRRRVSRTFSSFFG